MRCATSYPDLKGPELRTNTVPLSLSGPADRCFDVINSIKIFSSGEVKMFRGTGSGTRQGNFDPTDSRLVPSGFWVRVQGPWFKPETLRRANKAWSWGAGGRMVRQADGGDGVVVARMGRICEWDVAVGQGRGTWAAPVGEVRGFPQEELDRRVLCLRGAFDALEGGSRLAIRG